MVLVKWGSGYTLMALQQIRILPEAHVCVWSESQSI